MWVVGGWWFSVLLPYVYSLLPPYSMTIPCHGSYSSQLSVCHVHASFLLHKDLPPSLLTPTTPSQCHAALPFLPSLLHLLAGTPTTPCLPSLPPFCGRRRRTRDSKPASAAFSGSTGGDVWLTRAALCLSSLSLPVPHQNYLFFYIYSL